MEGYNVAIVGATGTVGRVLCDLIESREFPVKQLFLVASARSAGQSMLLSDGVHHIHDLAHFDFSDIDIAFFSAGMAVSEEYVPKAISAGVCVIDNTSCFRYDASVPLVIAGVNDEVLPKGLFAGVVANPNCSTMQMLLALNPIYQTVGIRRIDVCTYQAISGAGKEASEVLQEETATVMAGGVVEIPRYARQLAFNAVPHIDVFQENGYTREEMKMVWETHKIWRDDSVVVNPTCVRIPVFNAHSEAIHIETRGPITVSQAADLYRGAPGLILRQEEADYPTAVCSSSGKDPVYIGRLRQSMGDYHGLNLWVVGDNLRKGAALNALQIAEKLISSEQSKR